MASKIKTNNIDTIDNTSLTIKQNDTTAVTIDTSQNVFVKTTGTGTNIGVDSSSTGFYLRDGGQFRVARDNSQPILANRLNGDGVIIDCRKDGTTVGSINAKDGDIAIGTNDTALRFSDSTASLYPFNNSTNGGRDNAIDLGLASVRWQDLYLGGNIYLGGTGSANALDDYEEGTWTPAFSRASSAPTVTHSRQSGTYSKIGQTVIAFFDMIVDSYSGGGGDYRMVGLPFATNMSATNGGFSRSVIRGATLMSSDFRIYGDSSFVNASNVTLKNYNSSGNEVAVSPSSSGRLTGYIIYTTSS